MGDGDGDGDGGGGFLSATCAFCRRYLFLLWRRSVERTSFVLFASEFGLLAMAPNSGRSVPFPRCVVLLVTLALRRSTGADDFRAPVFSLKVF